MTFIDSIWLSLFGMSVVFVGLIVLYLIVVIQNSSVKYFSSNRTAQPQALILENIIDSSLDCTFANTPKGAIKLMDVDDKTAAMIIAIVSDETKIAVEDLQINYIKAID